ncbi:lamina-associated polypeptide 2, isoforms beta/delta/epsilon/gamma-like isoform X1 [Mytilus californianus]|uniref:lamina-associated polypeptide 2, isoforms beta/delta/epsilon/gamma-like isoform X1 n=1 Tax=Mytilus californianus TaxID=6549 RepID=UPI0022479004|nr:lamina-associated polypeptide 2, isoforms beta/delta/epsilon/gamma-like isoform X1 [Mytilus californianus]
MPIFTDPSKLTKAKLKEELIRFNVKLPPSTSKKQVLVDLYEQHISQLNDPSIFEDEFVEGSSEQEVEETESEDEQNSNSDIESETVSFEEPQKETKEAMTINAEDLSDKELANELRLLGFTPGPIGTTTRRVYEKKLVKLRQSSGDAIKVSPKLFQQRYDEVPDDEDKQPPVKPRSPRRRPPPRRIQREEPVDEPVEEPVEQKITENPVLTRRPLTARTRGKTERSSPTASSETTSTTEEKSGGGIPMWVKLVIFLLVAFFVYLVIVNMEPSADGKIPKSITEGT